jgi:GT2 family glycosyltransferase
VIVTHDSASVLPGCLASLGDAFTDLPYAVTVVDNASSDGTPEVARREGNGEVEVLVSPRNRGYAAAVNTGLAGHPDAAVVLVLNPDVRLAPGTGSALAAACVAPGGGIAVPRLVGADGELAWSLRRAPGAARLLAEAILGGHRAGRLGWGELVVDPSAYRRPTVADWATGAVLAMSRACIDAVGPWDERFFLYSEETDLCLRARALGFRTTLVPDAEAIHLGGDAPTSPPLWALLTWNRFDLLRRSGAARGVAAWAVLLAGASGRSLFGRRASVHRASVRALLHPWTRPLPPGVRP